MHHDFDGKCFCAHFVAMLNRKICIPAVLPFCEIKFCKRKKMDNEKKRNKYNDKYNVMGIMGTMGIFNNIETL